MTLKICYEKIVEQSPDTMVAIDPRWMCENYPAWMAEHYHSKMVEYWPHWLAVHRPDTTDEYLQLLINTFG